MIPGENISTGGPATCDECNETPKLDVYRTPAGFYVGTYCQCGPYSRESEYYDTHEEAKKALDSGEFGRPAGFHPAPFTVFELNRPKT